MANRFAHLAVLLLASLCEFVTSTQYLSGTHGCFASPGYPAKYPNGARESYRIVVRQGSRIKLRFTEFAIESHSSCGFDSLTIKDKDGSVLKTLCADSIPREIVSADNEISAEFSSDGSVTLAGFFATYTEVNGSLPTSSPLPSSSFLPTPSPTPSPVHGGWCPFNWTSCSVSCGFGQQNGYRYCACPPPSNGGQHCIGNPHAARNCSLGSCPSSSPAPSPTPTPSCGSYMTASSGTFSSPNYPHDYPNQASCTYEIRVPTGSRIILDFYDFSLETGYDVLELKQTVAGSLLQVARLTGSNLTSTQFTSAENHFWLHFTSDHSVTRKGFSASYRTISGPPPVDGSWCGWIQSTPCSVSCGYGYQIMTRSCSCPAPSNGGVNCTGSATRQESCYAGACPTTSTIPMPSPTPSCQRQVHTTPSGIIRSPGYPGNYHDNANCEYSITVQDGKAIKIDFTTFSVEDDSKCRYDKLAIYEGDSASGVGMATLCGDGPKSFTSTGNKLFMKFTSDASVTKTGFYGTYQTVDKPVGGGATINHPLCGLRRASQSRVIGGVDAAKGDWPWQVGMYMSGSFICGGTLIAPNWVLTASHCVVSNGVTGSPYNFEIVAGDLHREMNDTTEQKHLVERIIAHPNYDGSTLNNDIALMKLRTPVLMNDHVNTACIPNKTDVIQVGSTCFITGWGKIQHPGDSHTMLQQALLPVLNSSFCQSKIDSLGWDLTITKQMVCAGEVGSKKSGCHGDSGGPFVCPDPTGRFYLHGDVSWGSGQCDTSQAYTVFARVTEFVDWIKNSLKNY